jgi:hypothetical protein
MGFFEIVWEDLFKHGAHGGTAKGFILVSMDSPRFARIKNERQR